MRWHGFASNARHGVSVGLWGAFWGMAGRKGHGEPLQRLWAVCLRVTKAAALVLTLAHRPDPPVVIAPAGITTPRFSSASLSFPPWAGPSWNHNAAVSSVGSRRWAGEHGPATLPASNPRPTTMGESARLCGVANPPGESARRHCECRFPITMGESARRSVPANPPGYVAWRIRPAKCPGRLRCANPPGECRSAPGYVAWRIRPARTGRGKSASLETAALSPGGVATTMARAR